MSFSYFYALIRTFRMMLKCSGEKRHPCLVPDLTEKVPGFSLMLAIGLCIFLYQVGEVLYSWFTDSFYHEEVLELVRCLFCFCRYARVIFLFSSVYVMGYIN